MSIHASPDAPSDNLLLWRLAGLAEKTRRHAEFLASDEREDVTELLRHVEILADRYLGRAG